MRLINPRSSFAQLTRADRLLLGAGTVVFILVAFVRTLENALAVSMTFCVLGILVEVKWASRRDPRFWATIATVGVVQLPVAFLVHIPPDLAKGICLGLALPEGLVLLGLVTCMERFFPRADLDGRDGGAEIRN